MATNRTTRPTVTGNRMAEPRKVQAVLRKNLLKRKEDIFGATLQQTHSWLRDIMTELQTPNRHRAYLSLRAVLQTLRDRMTLNEAVHLGAQLPMLIRGLYYDGWNPSTKPVKYNKTQFLGAVGSYFPDVERKEPEQIVRSVFAVLQKRINPGEIRKVKATLPKTFGTLWPEPVLPS